MNRSKKYIDSSKLYQGYKDLNEWHTNFGKLLSKKGNKKNIGKSIIKM